MKLNEKKLKEAEKWDGLHGIITNAQELSEDQAIKYYHQLWQIEETFRVSKHDLRIRRFVKDINNITSWVDERGFHHWVIGGGSWNGAFPNGSNLGVIFSEGIIWGGKVNDGAQHRWFA